MVFGSEETLKISKTEAKDLDSQEQRAFMQAVLCHSVLPV